MRTIAKPVGQIIIAASVAGQVMGVEIQEVVNMFRNVSLSNNGRSINGDV
jgi:hypothetical protein